MVLEHIIQLDEVYFKRHGVIMGKEQGKRKLAYEILFKSPREMDKSDTAHFLQSYVKPKSKLRTDGGGIYRGIHYSLDIFPSDG